MTEETRSPDSDVFIHPQAMRNFLKDPVWEQLKATLQSRLESSQMSLETEKDMATVHYLQGEIRAVREFLVLPDVLLEFAEHQKEADRNE